MIVLALSAAAIAGLSGEQQAIVDCVSAHTVQLGQGSTAPAADIIPAAQAECFGAYQQARSAENGIAAALQYSPTYRAAIARGELPAPPTMKVDDPAFQQLVYGEGAKALLGAREKR